MLATYSGVFSRPSILREETPALTSPGDEEATYAVAKRGGTETITTEHIKNDDVGFIRSVPKKLSQAAKRTLSKFVLDFLRTNPVIYDGQPLFNAIVAYMETQAFEVLGVENVSQSLTDGAFLQCDVFFRRRGGVRLA